MKKDVLIVVDMQTDFIDGALGTPEAVAILPRVIKKIQGFDGTVLFTRDTHKTDYLNTQEGENLPVAHCIEGTAGWAIHPDLLPYVSEKPIDKPTFGSVALAQKLKDWDSRGELGSVTLVGLCTDICVISNAMLLKAFLPETPIIVDAACCAGVSPESHEQALSAMKPCQIHIINE